MNAIELRISTQVNGRVWNLFDVTFDTPDGRYSVYLYAISAEHAEAMLDDLKNNGRITGQIVHAERS